MSASCKTGGHGDDNVVNGKSWPSANESDQAVVEARIGIAHDELS